MLPAEIAGDLLQAVEGTKNQSFSVCHNTRAVLGGWTEGELSGLPLKTRTASLWHCCSLPSAVKKGPSGLGRPRFNLRLKIHPEALFKKAMKFLSRVSPAGMKAPSVS